MSNKITLSIPHPCGQNWQQMTQAGNGRFCNTCQKTVVDFSAMSDRQVLQYFQKQQGSVCGRFQQQQLNRVMTKPKTPQPFIRYFIQFTLPAFLLSLKANAQEKRIGKIAVCQTAVQSDVAGKQATPLPAPQPIARVKVMDETGLPIRFASLNTEHSTAGITCDANGEFQILDAAFFEKPILVSAIGYESKKMMLEKTADTALVLNISMQPAMMGLVVAGEVVRTPAKPVPLLSRAAKPQTYFTLFPNPATAGASVAINWNNLKKGVYVVQLQSVAGQNLLTTETNIEAKNSTSAFRLPQLPPGIYLITITNKKTGKTYSEKISVK